MLLMHAPLLKLAGSQAAPGVAWPYLFHRMSAPQCAAFARATVARIVPAELSRPAWSTAGGGPSRPLTLFTITLLGATRAAARAAAPPPPASPGAPSRAPPSRRRPAGPTAPRTA